MPVHRVLFSGGYRLNFAVTAQDLILRRMDEKWAQDVSKEMYDYKLLVRMQLTGMGGSTILNAGFRSLTDAANRSRVSFYSVDSRGLIAPEDSRFRGFSNSHAQLMREEISQPQNYLRDLAAATGGQWFLNTNDLKTGPDRAYLDSALYYELAYVPGPNSKPGTLHRISLRVARPDVRLNYRQSYLEPEAFDAENRAVENALKFPGLFEDFPIQADAGFVSGDLKVDVFVPTRSLVFVHEGGRHRCALTVQMALFDGKGNLYGGKLLFSRSYNLDFDAERHAQVIRSDNLTASYRGKVQPGAYRLRIAVRQAASNLTAALERRLTANP